MMPLAEGHLLGKFEIRSDAGGSFSGEVYRARHVAQNRDVYLRILSHTYTGSEEDLAQTKQAISPLFSLVHPHVLPITDLCCSGQVLFTVSDFQEGETLRQKLHRTRLQRDRASDFAVQLARALTAIHGTGFFHCDLKPENILITKDGTVRVMDAGVAELNFKEEPPSSSDPAVPILIADYASPEQIHGERETWASDMFSWGVILYEMLSGTRPFLRNTLPATSRAILTEEIPDLKTIRAPALDRIIRQATRKKPQDRFDSVRDVAFAMESFGSLTTPANKVRRNVRERQTLPFLISVAMLTLGFAAGALIARRYLRPTVVTQISFRPLTFSGHDSSPAASPDGKTVAFVSDRDGTERIWTARLDLQEETPITAGPDHAPRISPDGRTILFIHTEKKHESLFTVPAAGGKVTKVLEDVQAADWSPRSNQIAWLRVSGKGEKPVSILGTAGLMGVGAKELTRFVGYVLQSPRYSADARYLAASIENAEGVQNAVFVTRTDVANQQHVLNPPPTPGGLSSIAWLGTDQLLYFQSITLAGANGWPGGAANIVRQNVDTGATAILGFSQQSALHLDKLSGGALVFDSSSGRKNLEESILSSGASHVLTMGGSDDQDPAYSADGQFLYFSSFRGGNLEIWKVDRATGAFRRLIGSNSNDSAVCLSYNAARIFWSSSRDGHFEVYTSSVDGSFPNRLTHDGKDAEHPSVPLAGDWVVYNSSQSARRGVWKIRQTGLEDTQIVKGETRWPEISPDGRYVLYTTTEGGSREIHAALTETGAPALFSVKLPLTAGRSDAALGKAKWMPGGRSIAYVGQSEDGAFGIYVQPFTPGLNSSGLRRKLSSFDARRAVQSFAISPDGALLTIATWERGSALIEALNVPGL
jgi:Tol biopolymer transport system component